MPESGEDDEEDEDVEGEKDGEGEHSSDGDSGQDEFDDEYYESCESAEDSEQEAPKQLPASEPIGGDLISVGDATPSLPVSSPTVTFEISAPISVTIPSSPLPLVPTSGLTPATQPPPILALIPYIGPCEVALESNIAQLEDKPIQSDEDAISKRTRARHSLVNVELEELESAYCEKKKKKIC